MLLLIFKRVQTESRVRFFYHIRLQIIKLLQIHQVLTAMNHTPNSIQDLLFGAKEDLPIRSEPQSNITPNSQNIIYKDTFLTHKSQSDNQDLTFATPSLSKRFSPVSTPSLFSPHSRRHIDTDILREVCDYILRGKPIPQNKNYVDKINDLINKLEETVMEADELELENQKLIKENGRLRNDITEKNSAFGLPTNKPSSQTSWISGPTRNFQQRQCQESGSQTCPHLKQLSLMMIISQDLGSVRSKVQELVDYKKEAKERISYLECMLQNRQYNQNEELDKAITKLNIVTFEKIELELKVYDLTRQNKQLKQLKNLEPEKNSAKQEEVEKERVSETTKEIESLKTQLQAGQADCIKLRQQNNLLNQQISKLQAAAKNFNVTEELNRQLKSYVKELEQKYASKCQETQKRKKQLAQLMKQLEEQLRTKQDELRKTQLEFSIVGLTLEESKASIVAEYEKSKCLLEKQIEIKSNTIKSLEQKVLQSEERIRNYDISTSTLNNELQLKENELHALRLQQAQNTKKIIQLQAGKLSQEQTISKVQEAVTRLSQYENMLNDKNSCIKLLEQEVSKYSEYAASLKAKAALAERELKELQERQHKPQHSTGDTQALKAARQKIQSLQKELAETQKRLRIQRDRMEDKEVNFLEMEARLSNQLASKQCELDQLRKQSSTAHYSPSPADINSSLLTEIKLLRDTVHDYEFKVVPQLKRQMQSLKVRHTNQEIEKRTKLMIEETNKMSSTIQSLVARIRAVEKEKENMQKELMEYKKKDTVRVTLTRPVNSFT